MYKICILLPPLFTYTVIPTDTIISGSRETIKKKPPPAIDLSNFNS